MTRTINEARRLRRGQVAVITFRCTTPGPEPEEGVIEGYWTGEIDAWGKRTIAPTIGGGAPVYLFDHEIVTVDPY